MSEGGIVMIRTPAVAGSFYPEDPKTLLEEVENHVQKIAAKTRALGILSPHAGFMYSGDVAGAVYSRIEIPDTVIFLGPNHTGQGQPISMMAQGSWSLPMGTVKIDSDLAGELLQASSIIQNDPSAHVNEHCLETQIPFIQYFRRDFKIVPICLMKTNYQTCEEVSREIVGAINRLERRSILIVASSDMTHYESHESASRKDRQVIDLILQRDARAVFTTVQKQNITMCGVIPATIMLMCCNKMGASQAELVKYMTSGETSGDYKRVVGYAGVIIK